MGFVTVLGLVVAEGCVGETVAAHEAQGTLEHVARPTLRHVLNVIADDEAEHAALACGFARWALDAGGLAARAVAEGAHSTARSPAPRPIETLGLHRRARHPRTPPRRG